MAINALSFRKILLVHLYLVVLAPALKLGLCHILPRHRCLMSIAYTPKCLLLLLLLEVTVKNVLSVCHLGIVNHLTRLYRLLRQVMELFSHFVLVFH